MNPRFPAILTALGLVTGALAAAGPRIEGDKISFGAKAPQLAYLAVESIQARHEGTAVFDGRLAWDDDITARIYSPVSGRIATILAQPGQTLAAGDALLKIRSPDFGQVQADFHKAMADATLAERSLARARDLFAHGALAQKDVEAAEADFSRAHSEKERAVATLALYGSDGSMPGVDGYFTLRAPVGGMVVDKSVSPGQEVRADQVGDKPLFVISDPARLWLYLDVAEADLTALRPNQAVVVHARGLPNRDFHGRLEVISEGLDPATRTIKARCLVDNVDKQLRAEMYVSAAVITDPPSGVDLPAQALFTKGPQRYTFVETAPGQFQRRAVRISSEGNGHALAVEGLTAGDRVVTEGGLLLEAILEGVDS